MKVLLSTYGSRGDVEPMVALAVQLRALGAHVQVCAPPDQEFADLLGAADVPLVSFAKPWRSWARPTSAAERTRRVSEFIAAQHDTVSAAAEEADLLVAAGMSHFVAGSVAERQGIPCRYVAFCSSVMTDVDAQGWDALFGPPVNAHRATIGLPPVDDVRAYLLTEQPWLAADPTLDPWDPSTEAGVVSTGAWILPDRRPLPRELERFLEAGSPPVYVGYGSMRVSPDSAQPAIEAIRGHGHRTLLSRGWADLAAVDVRDDCLVVGEVNQQVLFRRVAAVVHHGGAGTTTTAARAGVPQVVVPQAADQPHWARRVAALGIGVAHHDPTPTEHSLSTALTAALAPHVRERSTTVARAIRTDAAQVAADLLLRKTSGPAPRRTAR